MVNTEKSYTEPDPAITAAFPYVLADNDRNRMVFSSGYRSGRQAALAEAASLVKAEIERLELVHGTYARGQRHVLGLIWATLRGRQDTSSTR